MEMAYCAYTELLSSIDEQDNQKGSLEEKKKRKITPIKKKTSATIVERESDDRYIVIDSFKLLKLLW